MNTMILNIDIHKVPITEQTFYSLKIPELSLVFLMLYFNDYILLFSLTILLNRMDSHKAPSTRLRIYEF